MIRKLTKMREYGLKTLFNAWRSTAVQLKLIEMDRSAMEYNLELSNLQTELQEAEENEKKLTKKVRLLCIPLCRTVFLGLALCRLTIGN